MYKLKPKSIASLLKNKTSVTNQYIEHAYLVLQMDRQLQKILPEPLNQHCKVANIHDSTLVIAVDSPAWSSRLRFHNPEILKKLDNELDYTFNKIQILVHPVKNQKHERKKTRPSLSSRSATLIQDTARSIDDPQLREALLRLSRRSRDK